MSELCLKCGKRPIDDTVTDGVGNRLYCSLECAGRRPVHPDRDDIERVDLSVAVACAHSLNRRYPATGPLQSEAASIMLSMVAELRRHRAKEAASIPTGHNYPPTKAIEAGPPDGSVLMFGTPADEEAK